MSTLIKTVILLSSCLLLSGCFGFNVKTMPIERQPLTIEKPSPLQLRETKFKVLKYEDLTYYALDSKGFAALSKNTEDVQNRLFLYDQIIEKQQEYYSK